MNAANAIPVPHPVVSPMPVGRRALAFGRHLVEMLIVMVVGMTILGLADGGVLRTAGLGAVRTERPLFDLVLMAVEMTLPMAAWMAYRGHARRDTIEMADAMLAPAVVLAALGVSGAVDPMTAEMVYHPLMLAAMVGVMLARRDVYAASHASHLRHAPGASAPDVSHSNPRASRASHEVTVMRHPSASPSLRPPLARLAAAAAIAGILIELGAAMGHPSHVQPNDSARVFAEYAESQIWVQVHLAQFLGSLLVGSAILLIAMSMRGDRRGAPAFAFIAALTGVLALAVFAVQMAVDGVALKAAFDAWVVETDPAQKAAAFGVAEVVRSLEKGLDGIFSLLNGLSFAAVGVAILLGRRYAVVLGVLAFVAGAGVAMSGWLTALTGFSPEAATFAGPAQIAAVLFLVGAAISLLRSSVRPLRSARTVVLAPATA